MKVQVRGCSYDPPSVQNPYCAQWKLADGLPWRETVAIYSEFVINWRLCGSHVTSKLITLIMVR